MVFSDELLEALAKDGISFFRDSDGSLSYTANYEHVVAVVYPETNTFSIESQVCEPGDNGKIGTWSFGEADDAEQLLRDIANATGNLDLSFESMFELLAEYE